MNFPVSYRIVEMVRVHIGSPYVQASDTDVARALGVKRNAVHEYKTGNSRMSADTVARALEILGDTSPEAMPLIEELRAEHEPRNEAQSAIWRLLRSAAEHMSGKAAGWIAVAMVAAGTIFAPAGNQASAASFDGPKYTLCALRKSRRRSLRAWLRFFTIFPVAILATGCTQLRPLAEYQHLSHATQHFGDNRTNYGYDLASVGVRWRPAEGVTVDLLEGYSLQEMHGRREVFSGRVTVEFGGAR